jgi:hypothetical protein
MISYYKCSKISPASSVIEGLWWTIGPSSMYFIGNWLPWISNAHGEVLKSWIGIEDVHLYGVIWLMMLSSWIMTTRMIHTTEIAVCNPSDAELKKFEEDLEKELKEKETEKKSQTNSTDH